MVDDHGCLRMCSDYRECGITEVLDNGGFTAHFRLNKFVRF